MSELLKFLELTESIYLNASFKLLFFIIAAIIVDFLVTKIIKQIVRKTRTRIDDFVINIIHKPILFTIILIGILLTIFSLNPNDNVRYYSEKISYTLAILIWMVAGILLTKNFIDAFLSKIFKASGMRPDSIPLIVSLTQISIIITSILLILTVWSINLVPIIASASIISAVILLAGKDTISNFFAGFSIILDQPYKIGDYIDLDQTDRGEVVEIGLRSTRIKTRDDILISIPNALIGNSKIINESAPEKRYRIRVPISISQGCDLEQIESILLNIANNNSNVISEPEPRVRLRTFDNGVLNYELLAWAKEPAQRGLTIHEINREIYNKFRKVNITIPLPKRDLHIKQS